jgi:hypothetical protein
MIGIPRMPGRTAWAILALLVVNALALLAPKFMELRPYTGVVVTRAAVVGPELFLEANFYKNPDCKVPSLVPVGFASGETDILPWRDMDGLPPDYDRYPGSHSLSIAIDMGGAQYDWVELRTKHPCGEDEHPVYGVFARIDIPEGLTESMETAR